MKMTHGEVILLRLLTRKDRYGYELDHIVDENRMRQWADIGFSSIYNILNKLEQKSLVSSYSVKEHGSPKRKVYKICEKGKQALREEVIRMLTKPEEKNNDFAVGLVTSDILSDGEFKQCMAEYKAYLQKRKAFYRQEIPQTSKRKKGVALALERFAILIEAELKWLDEQ